jgi:L-asparagine oxygenase
MELVFPRPVSADVLEKLALDGLDPLVEPADVAGRMRDPVAEAAGDRLVGMLNRFVQGEDSFLILRDAFRPIGLGLTPETFFTSGDTTWYPGGYTVLGLLRLAGLDVVSFDSENKGELVVNITIIPQEGRFGEKSRKELRGHTDACSFPFAHEFDNRLPLSPSPDFVVLIGQRNPRAVPTCVAPLSKIMKGLSERAIEELQKPQFIIGSQGLFNITYSREDASVVTLHPDFGYQVRFSHSKVTVDESLQEAAKAIKEMEESTQACLQDVVVNAGDILLVNNRTALHGRRTVSANKQESGGETRWIQRVYANLASTAGMPVKSAVPFCLAPPDGWVYSPFDA